MSSTLQVPFIAIACGGTGGHLFPGLAVAEALLKIGAQPALLVSTKAVDRAAAAAAPPGISVESLPGVGWNPRRPDLFLRGAFGSWRQAQRCFRSRRPDAVLAMGGFTSLGPVLEARRLGLRTFLHESNTIPGRANRWLARWVDAVYVGFPEAANRLRAREVRDVGTPVRGDIGYGSPGASRRALGLDPERPVLLICGGSQGARAINRAVLDALDLFRERLPLLQFLHLTGQQDQETVADAYRRRSLRAQVHGFCERMGDALRAADLAISRAGASTLAEFAAARLPSLLVPYPIAADDHQVFNARAFADAGAAHWCAQKDLTAEGLVATVQSALNNPAGAARMREALGRRHRPQAALEIARGVLRTVTSGGEEPRARSKSAPVADPSASRSTHQSSVPPFALAGAGKESC